MWLLREQLDPGCYRRHLAERFAPYRDTEADGPIQDYRIMVRVPARCASTIPTNSGNYVDEFVADWPGNCFRNAVLDFNLNTLSHPGDVAFNPENLTSWGMQYINGNETEK